MAGIIINHINSKYSGGDANVSNSFSPDEAFIKRAISTEV